MQSIFSNFILLILEWNVFTRFTLVWTHHRRKLSSVKDTCYDSAKDFYECVCVCLCVCLSVQHVPCISACPAISVFQRSCAPANQSFSVIRWAVPCSDSHAAHRTVSLPSAPEGFYVAAWPLRHSRRKHCAGFHQSPLWHRQMVQSSTFTSMPAGMIVVPAKQFGPVTWEKGDFKKAGMSESSREPLLGGMLEWLTGVLKVEQTCGCFSQPCTDGLVFVTLKLFCSSLFLSL